MSIKDCRLPRSQYSMYRLSRGGMVFLVIKASAKVMMFGCLRAWRMWISRARLALFPGIFFCTYNLPLTRFLTR